MEQLLYEGKSKKIFATANPKVVIQEFKDDATAFNAQKKEKFTGKGELNARICTLIYKHLQLQGVPTHFLQMEPPVRMHVRKLTMIPLEFIMRNAVAGSMAKRLGLKEGTSLERPIQSYHLKNDVLGDPMILVDEILALHLATEADFKVMTSLADRVNSILKQAFHRAGILLVDFKIEFGKDPGGTIYLADEISPDGCRLWDLKTHDKMDKDRFRLDLGGLIPYYQDVLRRLESTL